MRSFLWTLQLLRPLAKPAQTTDTAPGATDDSRDPAPSSDRLLRFAFAREHFSALVEPAEQPVELRIAVDSSKFAYLEVSVKLEADGSVEAAPEVNDTLDVLITAKNPPETCPCDDCQEVGPAGFEPAEASSADDAQSSSETTDEVPVSVGPGDRRKAVGLGQVLLNNFIAQLRLGEIDYAEKDNADDLKKKLDALPVFIRVTCTFDVDTEAATTLFLSWEGRLPETGRLDGPTWRRLIQTTEQITPFAGRPTPKFAEVGGEVDLLAVDGLGEAEPILLASIDNTIPKPTVRCARTFARCVCRPS